MLLKNALVFCHLLAMALAVAKMLEYDIRFLRCANQPSTPERRQMLLHTKVVMSWSLLVLWLTGAGLVAWGWFESPTYLDNQKLWIKVITVASLTLNGVLMHRFAFPLLQDDRAFLDLPLRQGLGLTAFAATSSTSWLYASFLGVARSWNHSAPLSYTLTVYVALLLAAVVSGSSVVAALHRRRQRHKRSDARAGEWGLHAG